MWRSAASKYALPNLPGEWHILDRMLILRPIGFIARGVAANDFSLVALLEPLFMPLAYGGSWAVAVGCDPRGVFPYHTLKDGESAAEKYMLQVVAALTETVLPFITENGSLEGYLDWCRRKNIGHISGIGDPHTLYAQAATAIVLRRPEDAKEALDGVRQSIGWAEDDREWVRELYEQAGALRDQVIADPVAVREELLAGMDEQKRRRDLPATG
jgi:hypothetical protein